MLHSEHPYASESIGNMIPLLWWDGGYDVSLGAVGSRGREIGIRVGTGSGRLVPCHVLDIGSGKKSRYMVLY